MIVGYAAPLHRAWARARGMLLTGASLETWFVLGFTAWLARLWDNAGLGGSWDRDLVHIKDRDWRVTNLDELRHLDFFGHELGGLGLGILTGLGVLALLLAVLLTWVSSRGEFCFLDNVVHRRARVSEPWRRFAQQGDSLFLWRLAFQVVAGAFALALILPGLLLVIGAITTESLRGLGIAGAVLLAMLGIVLAVAAALISFWTDQFVVPVMYRDGSGVQAAWRRTLPLVREHIDQAVLFALFWLLLTLVVGAAITVLGLLTCCIGWLVLAIPYLGTVIMLPIYVTARALGPEFLAQYGEEWRLWPRDGQSPPDDAGPYTTA
ncbi:MAG: hypothetical protein IPI34_04550 [bacterium]|nr:hypothetical protein [bacterium]